jgi:hypothetical protein
MSGRVLFAALHLLDRQLIDRDGRLCGNVDDLELTSTAEGVVYVSAIVSGPGALWYRLGRRRLGRWLRAHVAGVFDGGTDDGSDPDRIPIRRASDIGSAVRLSPSHTELATNAAEIWVRDHIIGHIPGSRHDADE